MGSNFTTCSTKTVLPQFLPYLHSGPMSPHLMTQWVYIPSLTYTVGTTHATYCTQTVQPKYLQYLHSGPISPHFKTLWVYTPSLTYTVGTTLAIYCTQNVQFHFLICLQSGPIPHFVTKGAPSSPPTCFCTVFLTMLEGLISYLAC